MPVFNLLMARQRTLSCLLALALLLWGGYGLYLNDLLIPLPQARPASAPPAPTYLVFSAFICGAMVLTAIVIDQHEIKQSGSAHSSYARYVAWFGWLLFSGTLLLHLLNRFGQAMPR